MDSLVSALQPSRISTQLIWLMAMVGAAILAVVGIVYLAFSTIQNLSVVLAEQHIGQLIERTRLVRDLNEVFAEINLLQHTFLGQEGLIASEGERLLSTANALAIQTENAALKDALTPIVRQLAVFLARCQTVNAAFSERGVTEQRIHRDLDQLEQQTSQWLIESTLLGKDTSHINQLLALVTGYRESLLRIDKMTATPRLTQLGGELEYWRQPILTAIDELALRLKTITASTPEVAAHGQRIATGVRQYRDTVNQLAAALSAINLSFQELNAVRQNALRILREQDREAAAKAHIVGGEIGRIIQSAQRTVIGFSILILTIATWLAVRFVQHSINQPLRRIIGGIDNIRRGSSPAWLAFSRAEEWREIEGALQELWSELTRSNDQIRELNASLERRVKERTVELEAANKELETYSYSVSHDLRTPLRGIDGYSSLLLQEYSDRLDAEGVYYLGNIREAAQRMGRMINDLMRFFRTERMEMQHTRVDLTLLAHEVLADLQQQETARQVECLVQTNLWIKGDPYLLKVILENLLGNAWKFTRKTPHARIELGVLEQKQPPVYYVRDNGTGFDMTYAHKLFVPLQRLHLPEEFEGTGIGLATAQRIIRRHGGKIWAEAEEGKGAVFYFNVSSR